METEQLKKEGKAHPCFHKQTDTITIFKSTSSVVPPAGDMENDDEGPRSAILNNFVPPDEIAIVADPKEEEKENVTPSPPPNAATNPAAVIPAAVLANPKMESVDGVMVEAGWKNIDKSKIPWKPVVISGYEEKPRHAVTMALKLLKLKAIGTSNK